MTLDDLGRRHGSDKSSLTHDYLSLYETQLRPMAGRKITLIEFGEADRAALGMWEEFFPEATIIGVFQDEAARSLARGRIRIEIGRQDDPELLLRLIRAGLPDVVIDDGSHRWADQIATLKFLFPALAPGGLYIVEDLHTSFGTMARTYGAAGQPSAFDYLTGLLPGLVRGPDPAPAADPFAHYLANAAQQVSFAARTCLIRKREMKGIPLLRSFPLEQAEVEVTRLDNGGAYRRGPIRIVDQPPSLAAMIEPELRRPLVEPPAARVGFLQDATVLGRGLVVTQNGRLIGESLINSAGRIHSLYRIGDSRMLVPERDIAPRRQLRDGECVLLKQTWDDNYGHWLVESLPRVALVAELRNLSSCTFIVGQAPAPMAKVYADSLSLFGIPEGHILALPDEPMRVDRLIYPAPLTVQPWVKAPRVVRVLEQIAEWLKHWGAGQKRPEKLYVSRNRTGRRLLRNESELIEVLVQLGYEVVHPEEMSFFEQVVAFSCARRVVGNLGAALTNLAFAPRGVALLALTSEYMKDDFFWDLLAHKDGSYVSLHGKADDPAQGMQSDFTIGLDRFIEVLMSFEAG